MKTFFSPLIILITFLNTAVYSQYSNLNFGYPMDRSVVVTGNYGEIRPNHFHAGLDFSTDPSINLPLKSVADGYVSRIKISSGGYGRVLYVTHPNGYVSVYAHQKKYADKIDAYVKQKQYEQKLNEIELYPTATELIVKKGEVIGYSGNSGSSTAPHLHFEIREEKSEVPINPLLVYPVKDDIKPMLTQIGFYSCIDTNNIVLLKAEAVKATKEKLNLAKQLIFLQDNHVAIAFAGYDQSNGSHNKNNIYDAKLKLDNTLIYHHQLNNISFDNGRYVNYFSEKVNGQKMQKCFTPTCYDIAIYKTMINGGKIMLLDTLPHSIELIVSDERGNSNSISFKVKAATMKNTIPSTQQYNAFCNQEFSTKTNDVDLKIPVGALTKNSLVGVYYNQLGKLTVGNKNDLLMKAYSLNIRFYNALKGKEKQMVLGTGNGCLTGEYKDGWFKTESKTFGSFKITYDTIAPTIVEIKNNKASRASASKKKVASVSNSIWFKVSDNLSGIGNYHYI